MDRTESEGFPEATISPMNDSAVIDNVGLILKEQNWHFFDTKTIKIWYGIYACVYEIDD